LGTSHLGSATLNVALSMTFGLVAVGAGGAVGRHV